MFECLAWYKGNLASFQRYSKAFKETTTVDMLHSLINLLYHDSAVLARDTKAFHSL